MAPLDHIESALLRRQSGLRQGQALPIRSQSQPSVGHRRDEQYLRAAAGLLRGQVLLQGFVLEAADAAEEVYFPGRDAEINAVLFQRDRTATALAKERGGHPLLAYLAGGIDRGQQFASLDAVLARANSTLRAATRRSRLLVRAAAMSG